MPKQSTQFDHKAHLNTLPLTEALWWFIENMDADNTATRDVFMILRERYRNEYQVTDKKLASGPEVTRTECGWPAHYICAARCTFHRNTLLIADNRGIVVSTVGNFRPEEHGHGPVEKVNADGYYETMAFVATGDIACGLGYIEADTRQQVRFESPGRLDLSPDVDRFADLVANTMHEKVVDELTEKLRQGQLV